MSTIEECKHHEDVAWLEDIEYKESEKYKEVAITFTCGDCGSVHTKYWRKTK